MGKGRTEGETEAALLQLFSIRLLPLCMKTEGNIYDVSFPKWGQMLFLLSIFSADIQKLCEHQAHRCGIRISRVSARNTSRLAYDGSGKVDRSTENHSLCRFTTGKCYHCDLSASYNIGARYFIRELLKPLPETERSSLEAKVPSVKRRTSCVYADLRKLSVEINDSKAA